MVSNNKPKEISAREWSEIAKLDAFLKAWGLELGEADTQFLSGVYGVRFDFATGGPGYCGPLYLIKGDGEPDAPPLILTRSESGELVDASDQ